MTAFNSHRRFVVVLACLSLALPNFGRTAAAETPSIPVTRDVQLDKDGCLRGQLVDREGHPVAHAWVGLRKGQDQPRYVRSTEEGSFEFAEMQGGVYQLFSAEVGGLYRVWTAKTAPPSSQPAIMLVTGDAQRGQAYCPPPRQMGLGAGHYGGAIMRTLNNPWIIGGAIAAGIAIPIAVSNNDNDGS